MEFKELISDEAILRALEEAGLVTATPIQEAAIPVVREGKDLLASAQTGTGKTAAFILPALERIGEKKGKGRGPRVLILTPTRELAMQVAKEAERFSAHKKGITTVSIFGGVPYPQQNRQLSRPFDILVATPGRLIDHLERKRVDLRGVEMVILDEADRMLDMGFVEPVQWIMKATAETRQTLLFSATLSKGVKKLAEEWLKNPAHIAIAPEKVSHEQIDQQFHWMPNIDHKHRRLDEILDQEGVNQTIIFTATKRSSEELADRLSEAGREVGALHGDMNQRQRTRTIQSFRQGRIQVLVATDVAARGLDVAAISHVVNFDLPNNAEDYVHRIGRTGRAGASGVAHSFVSGRDRQVVREIAKYTGQQIAVFPQAQAGDEQRRGGPSKKKRPFHGRPRSGFKSRGGRRGG